MQNQILHKDYTSYGGTFQPSLPLNFEFQIKKDDPVRLLLHCIHQMDLTPLYRSFRRAERNLVSPHQLLAILIYAYMNQIYSSRRIEGMPKGHPLHVSARRATRTGSHNHCPFSQGALCTLRQGDSGTNGTVSQRDRKSVV